MNKTKTCFLICPIGSDGTNTRTRADDLLELAIEPALEIFGFEVVRADKISRPSLITNDIITLVQDSELCIADLTDRNPNVFYEVGRRHETGKPIVQVIHKDQEIPFDLAGIRTIKYDVSDARSVRVFIEEIRSFVQDFEKSEYSVPSSGVSLGSIAQSIERLERSVAKISLQPPTTNTGGFIPAAVEEPSEQADIMKAITSDPMLAAIAGPRIQIQTLITNGQIDQAATVLSQSRDRLSDEQYYKFAYLLAAAGHAAGMTITLESLEEAIEDRTLEKEDVWLQFGSIVHYFCSRDEESNGISKLAKIIERLLKLFEDDGLVQAFVYNQMAKLYSGAGQNDVALIYANRAVDMSPDEEAYKRNRSLLQKQINQGDC